MLKAGVGRVDISPKLGVQLFGYPHCTRENTGVHDPLHATALHLDNGVTKITTVYFDLLFFNKGFCNKIRSMFDYPITFTCTHTHCGPRLLEPNEFEKEEGMAFDKEYVEELVEKVIALIKEVEKNTFDAEIATMVTKCGAERGIGGNRREKGGLCDPSLNVLAVREKNGPVRGIMVNYALHPTYLHAENTLVTADYPAYIKRYFHFARPEAVVMFAQGCSGNQSSRYHRVGQDFEEAARAGTVMAVLADNCINEADFTDKVDLKLKSFIADDLPMKAYPPVEEALKLKIAAEEYYESVKNADYITARNAELAMFGAQNNYDHSRMGDHEDPELPMEITTIAINDTLIVQLQGELFVEYALKIKELSPYTKTFVFEISNGTLPGYIYTEQAGKEGGYEVGTSRFAPSIEKALYNKFEEVMKNV